MNVDPSSVSTPHCFNSPFASRFFRSSKASGRPAGLPGASLAKAVGEQDRLGAADHSPGRQGALGPQAARRMARCEAVARKVNGKRCGRAL